MGIAGMHESAENRPPPDRRDQIETDWPRILEPVELADDTLPMLVSQSVQTSRSRTKGRVKEQRRRALALMRYPRGTSPGGTDPRSGRHLLLIMMQRDDTPEAYPSQISTLLPPDLATRPPEGRLRLKIGSDERWTEIDVAVKSARSAWMTETFRAPGVPRPDESVSVVIIGSRWALPSELTLEITGNIRPYIDAFYSRLDNGR